MAVDPNIKKKADDIRNKIYGKEVRESLASGLEAMSSDVVETVGRQDEVEGQWQNVVDETTGKDVISAPEIIAARDGEANLKARLDKEKQKVAAQLAQTNRRINNIEKNVMDFGAKMDGVTDDTEAFQNAIDSFDDRGGTLNVPPGKTIITEPLVFPLITGSNNILKTIFIEGTSLGNVKSGFISQNSGTTAIQFTGTGALFDARLGNESEVRFSGGIKNIDAFGVSGKGHQIGFNAFDFVQGTLKDVKFFAFDIGYIIEKYAYYATFENAHAFYNRDIGAKITYLNSSTIFKCRFADNANIGLHIFYGGDVANIIDSFFEGNGLGLKIEHTTMVNSFGNYYESNKTHINLIGRLHDSFDSVFNDYGSHFLIDNELIDVISVNRSVKIIINGTIITNNVDSYEKNIINRYGQSRISVILNGVSIRGNKNIQVAEAANIISQDMDENNQLNVHRLGLRGYEPKTELTNLQGRLPIYNVNGNLLGYVPIYN